MGTATDDDMSLRVLLVEDKESFRNALIDAFRSDGWVVRGLATGADLIELIRSFHPHLLVLDYVLLEDGREAKSGGVWARELRSQGFTVPILILTALDRDESAFLTAREYVDGFIYKSSLTRSMIIAEARKILRTAQFYRQTMAAGSKISTGDLDIDLEGHRVFLSGHEVHLAVKPYGILECLARNLGRYVSYDTLKRVVWGGEDYALTSVVQSTVTQLRKTIERDPKRPIYIENSFDYGYRLNKL